MYLIAWLAPLWALMTIVFDGVAFRIGSLRLSSTEPIRPLLIGLAAASYYLWRYSREEIAADGRRSEMWLRRALLPAITLIILLGCFVGIHYGSFAAAGSDSYGYVSQASLWLRGNLRVEQPIAQQMSWPDREWTFAPLGYRPLSNDGTIVPTYAPGLPILMAAFLGLFGANGPFLVVPVMGSLALWFTYLLGREVTGSRGVGAFAALLLLASPTFLSHVMQPMTDVPAAAGWTLVCLLALKPGPPTRQPRRGPHRVDLARWGGRWGGKEPRPRALTAGLVAGASLLIRPNLMLLTLVPVIAWVGHGPANDLRQGYRGQEAGYDVRNVIRFGMGLAPALIAIALLNTYLYRSPFRSGYGGVGELYDLSSGPANLRNYSLWLVQTQTPLVALAIIPLIARGALRPSKEYSSVRGCLAALLVLTLVSYIFYSPFGHWSYLRFLLPAYPALFVLMAAGVRFVCLRLPLLVRAPAAILIGSLCISLNLRFAKDQLIFNSREFERRHVRAAEYVEKLTPENAVILSVQHSGSLRYYAHRITLRYDALSDQRLDSTLQELREKGYRPYIVIDDWEETDFRKRFARQNRAGRLDWLPLARVPGNPEVRLYDPEGRD